MSPAFTVPAGADATAPPEWQGLARDEVRLMTVGPGGVTSTPFRDLPELLAPGDLVVVNTSATLPARVDARRADGVTVPLHVSATLDDGSWVVELRRRDNSGPDLGAEPGTVLMLPGGLRLTLLDGFPDPHQASRLRRARTEPAALPREYLPRHGEPIRYGYVSGGFPLAAYQNVYADEPGSAEMASAGRPFTERLLVRLMVRGIAVAPLTLHCGVSSPELHEPPAPEPFAVPAATARLVNSTRQAGRRVVAVGTTVTRALETATYDGATHATSGRTDLVLGADRPARAVTGLVTGLHATEASHLQLLEAVAGRELVDAAYRRAVDGGYRWHEFGDSMLFLP
ncbi:MAG: S-adenosylmethionine:tRNA ribosyltransferase-isomerase [Blastococcus sp.]